MKRSKLPFDYHPQEQRGVFYLLLLILGSQAVFWIILHQPMVPGPAVESGVILDTLRIPQPTPRKLPTFDVNRLTDEQAYGIGMPLAAIDALLEFRAAGGRVGDLKEFEAITGMAADSLVKIRPRLRFPPTRKTRPAHRRKEIAVNPGADLNLVTAAQLQQVRGIGPVRAARIVKFRDALGGFVSKEQLLDVYGLPVEVADRVLNKHPLNQPANPQPISLNHASREELAALVYIPFALADSIIGYRERVGSFKSIEELAVIPGFPSEKIDRIKLYLSL